jgi:hypothetical protein
MWHRTFAVLLGAFRSRRSTFLVLATLLAGTLLACEQGDASGPDDAVSIAFVTGETRERIRHGDPLPVQRRPQGVYGATVDLDVSGVEVDAMPAFAIEVVAADGTLLANQRFSSTSTGRVLETGAVALSRLPIVFLDNVERETIDEAEAELSVVMETSPPAEASIGMVLVALD